MLLYYASTGLVPFSLISLLILCINISICTFKSAWACWIMMCLEDAVENDIVPSFTITCCWYRSFWQSSIALFNHLPTYVLSLSTRIQGWIILLSCCDPYQIVYHTAKYMLNIQNKKYLLNQWNYIKKTCYAKYIWWINIYKMATFFLTFKCHVKNSTHSRTMYPVSDTV